MYRVTEDTKRISGGLLNIQVHCRLYQPTSIRPPITGLPEGVFIVGL